MKIMILEVDVKYPENLFNSQEDLPFNLREKQFKK